ITSSASNKIWRAPMWSLPTIFKAAMTRLDTLSAWVTAASGLLVTPVCRGLRVASRAIGAPWESGDLGTKSLLAQDESVTAILAGNDPPAHGVYKALRDRNLRVPDDVSVIGCDDTVGTWLYPPLTTTREFPEQLGKQLG